MNERRPPDTRPGALLFGGLQRGILIVFVPVLLAGQALAWLAYAIGGWFRPWSWVKIGLAYSLMGARVPFTATVRERVVPDPAAADGSWMIVALGALTLTVIVLAFRAGQVQAKGLEKRPWACALAGVGVGLGLAVPMFLAALLVRLSFPNLGIHLLKPVLWQAFVLPLAIAGVAGAVGGLSKARGALDKGPWGARVVGAARGGFTALWWGVLLAFLGFLVLAVVEFGTTRTYGRVVGGWDSVGAVTVVHHALLLPNQTALMLGTSMGVPTELVVNDTVAARVTLSGLRSEDAFTTLIPGASFGPGYLLFLLAPGVATVLGGRVAGEGARSWRERALRGALAGLVYAALAGAAIWAAGISVPLWATLFRSPVTLRADPVQGALFALAWGVVLCTAGSVVPRPRRAAASTPYSPVRQTDPPTNR